MKTLPPPLAITMGDPAGVGPELCLQLADLANEVLVYGHREILERCAAQLGVPVPDSLQTVDFDFPVPDFTPGQVDKNTGHAAYHYLNQAIDDAISGKVSGLVTCPISKSALFQAGYAYPGHTEILVKKTGVTEHAMMLSSDEITCSLVTTHIGLKEVPLALEQGGVERIVEVGLLTAAVMKKLRGRPPALGFLGLNPHAGEDGLFGDEEERLVRPAMQQIKEALGADITLEGPFPPDTAFLSAIRPRIDAYVCLYHDQGLIPLKTLAFDEAVNITLGLPFVRTSVDHGTAADIAWSGQVKAASFLESIRLAKILCS